MIAYLRLRSMQGPKTTLAECTFDEEWWQQSTVVRKSCAKLFAGIRNTEDLVICLPPSIPPQPSYVWQLPRAGDPKPKHDLAVAAKLSQRLDPHPV